MHDYLNDHQIHAVQALRALKKVCDANGITMYLLAGSCLGAVREQGMIPWDDDVDVGFTYNDWYKIRKILCSDQLDGFEYADYMLNDHFPRLFGKLLYEKQNCVDLFLIAKWTKNKFLGNLHWQYKRLVTTWYSASIGYKNPGKPNLTKKQRRHTKLMRSIRLIPYWVIRPFCNTSTFIRMTKKNESYFEKRKSDCYINYYSVYKMEKERIESAWIEHTSEVIFEDELYDTVGDTDAYLTHLYGDYMTPPPNRDRVALHIEKFT